MSTNAGRKRRKKKRRLSLRATEADHGTNPMPRPISPVMTTQILRHWSRLTLHQSMPNSLHRASGRMTHLSMSLLLPKQSHISPNPPRMRPISTQVARDISVLTANGSLITATSSSRCPFPSILETPPSSKLLVSAHSSTSWRHQTELFLGLYQMPYMFLTWPPHSSPLLGSQTKNTHFSFWITTATSLHPQVAAWHSI